MTNKNLDTKVSEKISLLKIVADKNRYCAIVLLMRSKGGASVGEIAETLNMSHSSVSHMLAVLHDASVVSYKKKGREVLYGVAKTPVTKRIARIIGAL